MQDIWMSLDPYVQDQHYFVSFIVDNLFMRRTFQDHAEYPRILDIVDLKPLRGRHTYKGLLEVGPARLLAAMLGDLGVSTLCLIKTMTQFSSLF
jgi:hypothetical protein